ncbi:hypothetical protein BH10CHL1_BH10CHL1_06700 [soil metagenome]
MTMNASKQLTAELVQAWLISHLATVLDISPAEIDIHAPFDRYGLDSLAAITLTGELEEWLDQELPVTLAWDYPNIELLAQYLVEIAA